MHPISTIIVDDEPLAREGLSLRLGSHDGFSVTAACANSQEAISAVVHTVPDVIFVDIEMPGVNGIELINKLRLMNTPMPIVVFVTAYSEFAQKAFECEAIDYVLKPFTEERLLQCLQKIQAVFAEREAVQQQQQLNKLLCEKTGKSLDGFIQTLNHTKQFSITDVNSTLALKSGSQWQRVNINEVLWLEAAGDYVCVHTEQENVIVRTSLKQLHGSLCQQRFIRVNRSVIVNSTKICSLTPNSNGEYIASLSSGDCVKVSRRYKLSLRELRVGRA